MLRGMGPMYAHFALTWPWQSASVVAAGLRVDEACVACVAFFQHCSQYVDGLLHSDNDNLGLAEVALGITRRMGERNVTSRVSG